MMNVLLKQRTAIIICLVILGMTSAVIGSLLFPSRSFSGLASVYEDKQTASGEKFDRSAFTAAHRTLPFGTRIRVSRGDKSVVVVVNDRGPFVAGRVLDLSPGAAKKLGFDGVEKIYAEIQ